MIVIKSIEARQTYNIPNTPIEEMGFSKILLNCLKNYSRIKGLHDILYYRKIDLRNIRQFGEKSQEEMDEVLAILNLALEE